MRLEYTYLGETSVIPTLADYIFIFTGQDLANPDPREVTFAFTNEGGEHANLTKLVSILGTKNRIGLVDFKITKEDYELEFKGDPKLFRMSDVASGVSEIVVDL